MAKAPKVDKEKSKLVTPEFRVSYPHLFKAQAVKGSKPKFSVTMLFDKQSDISPIQEAIRQAKIAKYGPNKADWPSDLRSAVSNGDNPKYSDKEGYKGHWVIRASSSENQPPDIYGPDAGANGKVQPLTNPAEVYPGCYGKAYVYAYVWDNEFGHGVGFILDGFQKTREGKSFGGRKSGDQVFAPINAGRDDDMETEVSDFSEETDDNEMTF